MLRAMRTRPRRQHRERPQHAPPRPDYHHLPERPDPSTWVTSEDVTPPNPGPQRFAFNEDVFLIERYIGIG